MASSERQGPGLAREAIGLREVLFQSVTHMAPAAAVAFSIPAGAAYAAGALPLATLLALIACLFVALSIGELARHLPSAGSFYTYASKGIHPWMGFLVAWAYAFAEAFIASFLFLVFAITVSGTLNTEFGWSTDTWWIWVVLSSVLVFVLGYVGIQISTEAGTIMGVFEIVIFGALAIWLIIEAGSGNTLSVFTTKYATAEGYAGISGVIAACVFSILAFTGFESAAPLAEEARDPRRTIRKAVIYSALAIGAFYVFTTYAATVYEGPGQDGELHRARQRRPLDLPGQGRLGRRLGTGVHRHHQLGRRQRERRGQRDDAHLVRDGPDPLAAGVHGGHPPALEVPAHRRDVQFVVALVLALALGFQYEPYTAFILMATIFTLILISIYIVILVACIAYYWRFQRQHANVIMHGLIPVLGIAVFVPVFLTAAGIPAFKFVSPLAYPISLAGPVVGVWMVIGIVFLIYLANRHPDRLAETARIFIDEPEAAADAGPVEPACR